MGRILVLEPDAVMSKLYQQIFGSLGHEVDVKRTAQAAVHCCDDNKPDAIVMELQLVGHSGIEFLYELRSYNDWQNIPVVIMSHVPPQEFLPCDKLLKKTLGVSHYFYKPQTSLATLLGTVRQLTATGRTATLKA